MLYIIVSALLLVVIVVLALWPVPDKYPFGMLCAAITISTAAYLDHRAWASLRVAARGRGRVGASGGLRDRTLYVMVVTAALLGGWTVASPTWRQFDGIRRISGAVVLTTGAAMLLLLVSWCLFMLCWSYLDRLSCWRRELERSGSSGR